MTAAESAQRTAPSNFTSDPTIGLEDFRRVRARSEWLCCFLQVEDFGVQPMPDASPPKWHLAHTSWFFETFLLRPHQPSMQPYHPAFEHLFNSYYNGVGKPFPRSQRGNLSRPTVEEVMEYRAHIDASVAALLAQDHPSQIRHSLVQTLQLGLHHEQQHQELLLTDIKYNLGHNPLYPALKENPASQLHAASKACDPLTYTTFEPELIEVGAAAGFCFDNELPRHSVYLAPYALADRLVTNAEYLDFINAGGYQRADLWLSEAWAELQREPRHHPLYWNWEDGQWFEYRLDGYYPLVLNAPVVHISGYDAAAFAAWSDARLPTEFEWEHAASMLAPQLGNFMESQQLHPLPQQGGYNQMFGDVWEWTSSSYGPYPGYCPLPGVLGEYNGKFMSSQWVLRGGSCATPQSHIRASYRNFFYPKDSWQFSGLRLARNL